MSTPGSKFKLENPYLTEDDYLYHLHLSTEDDLVRRFHDVKFVCIGGKGSRMKHFAEVVFDVLGKPQNSEFENNNVTNKTELKDISEKGGRYSMFKVGPVISASHGIGSASMSVAVHELLKLVHYAGCSDVTFIRIGTSGGLGLEPGTVVITKQAYDGMLRPFYTQVACGKEIQYDCVTTEELNTKLQACAESKKIKVVIGNTLAADDFYEEQGRLDGALCIHTLDDKMEFLKRAHDEFGVKNMEMESCCFAAMCGRAKVKCAVVCVCLLNRLHGDCISTPSDILKSWEKFPKEIIAEFLRINS